MKCKSICFCIPGYKKKEIQGEEAEKSSHSHSKSGKGAKKYGDDQVETSDHGHDGASATNTTSSTSNDAAKAAVIISTAHVSSTMEGSGCGSSHGGSGGANAG
ncbi:hypothetical protein Patl1_31249 [Pistacia atlantica]|uniref:Uncharacterized protein n=1 Tax=Pistacia atlantica TaxID=434234 RepID=A0ACC1ABH0_9ROSI|nr:hypothetical protein Patl1_31249 [Pistacia atlantica]